MNCSCAIDKETGGGGGGADADVANSPSPTCPCNNHRWDSTVYAKHDGICNIIGKPISITNTAAKNIAFICARGYPSSYSYRIITSNIYWINASTIIIATYPGRPMA